MGGCGGAVGWDARTGADRGSVGEKPCAEPPPTPSLGANGSSLDREGTTTGGRRDGEREGERKGGGDAGG